VVSTRGTLTSPGERAAAIQVLRGVLWTGAGLLGLATFVYGAGLALLGDNVGSGLLPHVAVRALGLLLIVAGVNVGRSLVKQESAARALVLDVIGLIGVVAVLWILVAPK
jgi:hypothetical protein